MTSVPRILILSSDELLAELVCTSLAGLEVEIRLVSDRASFERLTERQVFDLVIAIAAGMLITMVLFMKMVSEETEVKGWKYYGDENSEVTHLRELPKSVRVYEINGPMFFGMTERIADISVKTFTKYLIIRMRGVPSLDSTGMNALENLYRYCDAHDVSLIFSHVNEQPMKTMRRAGFVDLVGEDHFRGNIDDAIAFARQLLDEEERAGKPPAR